MTKGPFVAMSVATAGLGTALGSSRFTCARRATSSTSNPSPPSAS
ncbi:hypothetical protein ACFQ3Z_04485 [Streptomyces nogalater]